MIRALVLFVVLATATSVSHATTWRFDFTTTGGDSGTFFLDTTLLTSTSPFPGGANFFGLDLVNVDVGAIATEPGQDQVEIVSGGSLRLVDNFSAGAATLFLAVNTLVPATLEQNFAALSGSINLASSTYTIDFGFGEEVFALGSLTVTQVPLPAAAWLFLSALAGLGMMRNRRRTQFA